MEDCKEGMPSGFDFWSGYVEYLPTWFTHASYGGRNSMYVDDHQIYAAGESSKGVEKKLIEDGERMTRWHKDNLLKVNCDKYQSMMLGHGNTDSTINLSVGGEQIEQSRSIKILGVNIDEKLNFNIHISAVCKRVSRQVGILNRLKNLIPSSAKLQLYKSAIILHLTYCHLVWHFSGASDWRKLVRLQ